MSTLDDAARRLWVWTLVDPFQRDGLRLCGFATRRPTPSPAATRPSLGVTQKVSRCREPLGLVRAAQAVEKHLHGLVDLPHGSLKDQVEQQWVRRRQAAEIQARHPQSPRRHAAAFVEELSLDSPEVDWERRR